VSLENSVASILEKQTDRFYGKYRGLVFLNVDPQSQGRIKAIVPEVLGVFPSNWCLPCAPYAGTLAGLFTVPMIGTGVWIEFEAGDVNRPVWTGCWWGAAQVPLSQFGVPALFQNKVLRTDTGLTIGLDDATRNITITSDLPGMNSLSINLPPNTTLLTGANLVILNAPQIVHGQLAFQHAVLGEQLLAYLNTLVLAFNTHIHPGELAMGVLPVTPAPAVPPMLPPTPNLLSLVNWVQ
jgi:hypothetical protein